MNAKQRAATYPRPKNADIQNQTVASTKTKNNVGVSYKGFSVQRPAVYEAARKLAQENAQYFLTQHSSESHKRFSTIAAAKGDSFVELCEHISDLITSVEPSVALVNSLAPFFDYEPNLPGNGFRSVVAVYDTCVLHIIRLLMHISKHRSSVTFSARLTLKELKAYTQAVEVLAKGVQLAKRLLAVSRPGQLFPENEQVFEDILNELETIVTKTECFYGRCVGFQFTSTLTRPFQVIGVGLAAFSEGYDARPDGGSIVRTAVSLLSGGKYFLSPERRAERIVKVTQRASVEFCKAFWNIAETDFMQQLTSTVLPSVAVREHIELTCDNDLTLPCTEPGQVVQIPAPRVHCGHRSLFLRLLSHTKREGMVHVKHGQHAADKLGGVSDGAAPKSDYLLFHCHGGGFVAQSSKSHETYLRHWSKYLNVPIVSVDYSLAPECPYPRAQEETLYAYAWCVNNAEKLGWTGEKICFVGDSAGGNLLTTVCLRLIDNNVAKMPNGLVLIYSAFMLRYTPSPSRFLSLIDPLLPLGIVVPCMAAYTGNACWIDDAKPPEGVDKVDADLPQQVPEENCGYVPKAKACRTDSVANPSSSLANFDIQSPEEEVQSPTDSTENNHLLSFLRFSNGQPNHVNQESDQKEPKMQQATGDNSHEYSYDADERNITATKETLKEDLERAKIDLDTERIYLSCSLYDEEFLTLLKTHESTRGSLGMFEYNESALARGKRPLIRDASHTSLSTAQLPDQAQQQPRAGLMRSSISLNSIGQTVHTMKNYVWDGLAWLYDKPVMGRMEADNENMSDLSASPTYEGSEEMKRFRKMVVPKDPFLSPVYASDELLARMPPTYLVACHMDPLLDDSIMFAKRLKHAKATVNLEIVDGLHHGFLNFTLVSPECRQAAKMCLGYIRQVLGMQADNSAETP